MTKTYITSIATALVVVAALVLAGCGGSSVGAPPAATGGGIYTVGSSEAEPFITQLWAGAGQNDTSKGIDVGEVRVWNDEAKLYVKYVIDRPDWSMTEAHVYVNTTKPTTGAPGQLGHTAEGLDGLTEYTFEIDRTGWTNGTQLYIAAHAVVGLLEGTPGGCVQESRILKAGNSNYDVGSLIIYRTSEGLRVVFQTIDGWEITATHVWLSVGSTCQIPPTSAPGQFKKYGGAQHDNLPGVTYDEYFFPFPNLTDGQIVSIAGHATVRKLGSDGITWQTETAWGEGEPFSNNWAMYFCFEVVPCEPGEMKTETAWAWGDYELDDYIDNAKWGWFFDYTL